MVNRATLDDSMQEARDIAPELIEYLEEGTDWYASFFMEKKLKRTVTVHASQSVQKTADTGVVLSLYNGETFYEEATDDVSLEGLKKAAKSLREKVDDAGILGGRREYSPPTWEDRLKQNLDEEVRSQIPDGVDKNTKVHFGIRYDVDPFEMSISDLVSKVVKRREDGYKALERFKEKNSDADVNQIAAMMQLFSENNVFVDRETNMSQTILRSVDIMQYLKGSDRVFSRKGGVGGLETANTSEKDMDDAIETLHRFENAERLNPGKYKIITGPGVTGVIAHEAFGHSQEADTCARGRSKAWEMFLSGEKAGNKHATIINNPAVFKNGKNDFAATGSYFFDGEGWLGEEQTILDEGKLCSPMTNLSSALRLGVSRTANGIRQSWRNGNYARQTNTYFTAGDSMLEDMIKTVDYGFLAVNPAGGMEDPKGMGIQVGIQYLEEIKDGELTGKLFVGPSGGVIQMTGSVIDILENIVDKSRIRFDEEGDEPKHPDNKVGGCGKYHKELVRTGCGGPYLLMEDILLG